MRLPPDTSISTERAFLPEVVVALVGGISGKHKLPTEYLDTLKRLQGTSIARRNFARSLGVCAVVALQALFIAVFFDFELASDWQLAASHLFGLATLFCVALISSAIIAKMIIATQRFGFVQVLRLRPFSSALDAGSSRPDLPPPRKFATL